MHVRDGRYIREEANGAVGRDKGKIANLYGGDRKISQLEEEGQEEAAKPQGQAGIGGP